MEWRLHPCRDRSLWAILIALCPLGPEQGVVSFTHLVQDGWWGVGVGVAFDVKGDMSPPRPEGACIESHRINGGGVAPSSPSRPAWPEGSVRVHVAALRVSPVVLSGGQRSAEAAGGWFHRMAFVGQALSPVDAIAGALHRVLVGPAAHARRLGPAGHVPDRRPAAQPGVARTLAAIVLQSGAIEGSEDVPAGAPSEPFAAAAAVVL